MSETFEDQHSIFFGNLSLNLMNVFTTLRELADYQDPCEIILMR
jgi:hypothetical protein